MLLLVTILLVLVAAVTLLIGIFSDNLALIFVSIGASALAAIVLAVLSQVSKRKGRETAPATGPEPLPAREPVTVGGGRQEEQAAASIAAVGAPVAVPSDAPTTTMSAVGASALPIANYDSLRVNEILPALEELDLDQLENVAQHEESNKNRTTVLNRIDDLMDELEAQEGAGAPAGDVAAAAVESIEEIGEPVVAEVATTTTAATGFPIPDYDDLDEDELIARFEDLDADQLEAIADREEAGQNRDAVLDAIDDRLDVLEGIVPAAPSKKAAAATATKAPAKKVATKAAAATKTAAKAPAPAKKASAKKATPPTTTRKAAAPAPPKRSAPVAAKKTASAPAKKAVGAPTKTTTAARTKKAATRAPATKATAPAAKATKKAATTAKKSAPVKKASAAKKASKR